jgi:abequosyltransferase
MELSIGIPTYNGSKTIGLAIESIVEQICDGVEIVISDNASTDNTEEIVNEYLSRHSSIKYFRNDINVGMDRNFDLVVQRSKGKYVWILSDDDHIINKTAIRQVLNAIKLFPDNGAIFANYENKEIPIDKDYFNIGGNDFFRITKFKSTLISSTIVNRNEWNKINKDAYYGTYWVHIGYLIHTNAKLKSTILHEVLVEQIKYNQTARRWGMNGTFYNVGIDLAIIYLDMDDLGYSKDVCHNARRYIKDKNYWNIPLAKKNNLKVTPALLKKCIRVFWFFPSFWLFDLPLLLIPRSIYDRVRPLYRAIKCLWKRNK